MRFLGVGETNDLAAMYRGLQDAGHEVRVNIEDEDSRDVMGGMLRLAPEWQAELGWLRGASGKNRAESAPGDEGIVIFESASKGEQQDMLRAEGFLVIGGSALGDRLEADRAFGQDVLRESGLHTAPCRAFTDWEEGIAFAEGRPRRYVLKFNGADSERTRNYVGTLGDGRDIVAVLRGHAARDAAHVAQGNQASQANHPSHLSHLSHANHDHEDPPTPDFVLMDYVEGVEVGVGGYFNGHAFLDAACIDFEHKHFFPGELGELTGEMGTVVSYRGSRRLFDAVLAPLAPLLRDSGYCGYINVNLIVNDEGLWPLEFTSRFGYPGYAICEALHTEDWAEIFSRMVNRRSLALPTRAGFSVGVVLTVPPFPYRAGYEALSKGNPVFFEDGMTAAEHGRLALAEVARVHGQLCMSGATGYLGVATGTGSSVGEANQQALAVARKVHSPNMRYRTDIGDRVASHDWRELQRMGWVDYPGR